MKKIIVTTSLLCFLFLRLLEIPAGEDAKKAENLFKLPTDSFASYYLLTPSGFKSTDKYPLIVSLHGAGEKGDRMVRYWKEAASNAGCVLCCPNSEGFSWDSKDIVRIVKIVEYVRQTYSIDPNRILLNGISAGGAVTYYLGLSLPNYFRCLNPMSAAFGDAFKPLLDKVKPMPVYITHGAKDNVISPSAGTGAAQLLKQKGFDVTFVEKPNDGHQVPEGEQEAILKWFADRSSQPNPAEK
jgi:phospholipase/carboxylesterase